MDYCKHTGCILTWDQFSSVNSTRHVYNDSHQEIDNTMRLQRIPVAWRVKVELPHRTKRHQINCLKSFFNFVIKLVGIRRRQHSDILIGSLYETPSPFLMLTKHKALTIKKEPTRLFLVKFPTKGNRKIRLLFWDHWFYWYKINFYLCQKPQNNQPLISFLPTLT